MAWKLTVAGVDKTASVVTKFTPSITLSLNNRGQARFTVNPGYVPNRNDQVVIYAQDGVTKLFGGLVIKRQTKPFGPHGTPSYYTDITCADFSAYGDWCYSSRAYSSGPTLKQVLTDLVSDCLSAYGITLDAAQVTGPTLAAFSWNNTKVSDALRSLSQTTGYVCRIDPNKALKMFLPGTDAAPFTITDAAPHCLDFHWEDSDYVGANKVILACGPSGTSAYNQSWTQAGAATSWQADIPEASGAAAPFLVQVGIGTLRTVTLFPDTSGDYYWDRTTSPPTLRLGTDPTPSNGTVLAITYTAQYPFTVSSASGATPVIAVLAADPTVTQLAVGTAEAAGLLTSLNITALVASVTSINLGWLPGQALTVNSTNRGISASFALLDVQIDLHTDLYWVYSFTATEASVYQGTPIDQWRALIGGGSSSVAVALTGGGGGVGGGVGGSGVAGELATWTSGSVLSGLANVAAGSALVSGSSGPSWTTSPSLTALTLSWLLTAGSISTSLVASDLVPDTTDTRSIGSASKLWKQSWISTINAIVFAETTQTLFGGYSTIGKNAGALAVATTVGGTTIDFGTTMTPNDFVLMRAHDTGGTIRAEYIQVGTLVSGTKYNVSRDLANSNPTNQGWAFAAGTPFLVLGSNGTGRIDLLAYDGKPRIVFTLQGSTYNTESDRVVIGNLNTYFGYSSDIYGFAAGDPSNTWIKVDPTNGLRIGHASTTTVSVDASGNAALAGAAITLGQTSGYGVFTSSAAVQWLRNSASLFGQTGDAFTIYALSSGSTQQIQIQNICAGNTSSPDANAVINLSVAGWTLATHSQSGVFGLQLESDTGGSGFVRISTPSSAGPIQLNGAVTIASTLGVTGAVTMSSTLAVTGAITIGNSLSASSGAFASFMNLTVGGTAYKIQLFNP